MIYMLYALVVCLFFSNPMIIAQENNSAEMIIFSYDRPLQLYALLESVKLHMHGLSKIYIIYLTSEEKFEKGYQEVQEAFPNIVLLKQTVTATENDFYQLTRNTIQQTKTEYILFAVDDDIVKDTIHLAHDIELLKQSGAYGLFYRLGLHLSYCYPHTKPNNPDAGRQPLPKTVRLFSEDLYEWDFKTGSGDWGYPNNVDMTLYNTTDILEIFLKLPYFNSPNTLEGSWAKILPDNRKCLCHAETKMVNIPINVVQTDFNNRAMHSYTTEELLEIFNRALKIDIEPLFQTRNKSAHIEYDIKFISRIRT